MKSILTSKSSTNIEEKIVKIKPKYYWIVSALLAGFLAFFAFSIRGILGTGKYSFLWGDNMEHNAPIIKSMVDSMRNGVTIWYSFGQMMGSNQAYEMMATCWSPFNLLYLPLGFMNFETATQIIVILKIMCIAAAFTVFARAVHKVNGPQSIFFSLCYAFGGYVFAYGLSQYCFLDGLIFLPLVLAATVVSFETNKKHYLVVINYSLLFITNFYFGYSIGIFTLVYVCSYLIFTPGKPFSKKMKMFIKWAGCVCIAILVSALFLLPGILYFLSSGYKDGGVLTMRGVTVFNILNTLFWGTYEDIQLENSFLYSGLPVAILAPMFFFDRNIEKKVKWIYGILLGVFLAIMSITPLYYVLCAFDVPNGFHYRFGFAISFALCVIAMIESEKLQYVSFKKMGIFVVSIIAYYGAMIGLQALQGKGFTNSFPNWGINAGIILIWFFMFWVIKSGKASGLTQISLALVLIFAELTVSCYDITGFYLINRLEYENYYHNLSVNADTIQEKDKSFYRIFSADDIWQNAPMFYNYNGISSFGSCLEERTAQALGHMGFTKSPRNMTDSGYTPVTEMLLDVKYHINAISYDVYYDTPQVSTPTVNSNILSVGYMVNDSLESYTFGDENVFDNLNSLLVSMSGEKTPVFVPTEYTDTVQNGLIMKVEPEYISIKKETIDGGYIFYELPGDEQYDKAYMQFVTNFSGYFAFDKMYATGGENVFGIGSYILSSIPYQMYYNEKNDMYVLRIDAGSDFYYDGYNFAQINTSYFSQDALDEYYEDLSKEQLTVDEWEDGYIKGHIDVNSDRRLLFLSIPNEKGWNITVNGQKVEPIAVLDDGFMAIRLPGTGSYDIEMKFVCPGVRVGLIITSVGVLLTVLLFVLEKLRKSDNEETEECEKVEEESVAQSGNDETAETTADDESEESNANSETKDSDESDEKEDSITDDSIEKSVESEDIKENDIDNE